MLNKEEIKVIFIVTLITGFILSLKTNLQNIHIALGLILIVIVINIFGKKIASYYLDSEIEIKMWEVNRVGLFHWFNILPIARTHPSQKLKKPIPMGIILPLIVAIITLGNVIWLATTTFDVKKKVYRAARRYELYTFSEMTEFHIGIIAFFGIVVNLLFAVIGYLMGWTQFANLNILFAFFNTLPISNLDGNKIFFGSLVMWSFLAALIFIAMGFLIFVV